MTERGCVLDASALLAAMQGETGAARVESRFGDACISAVNLSEAVAKLTERNVPAQSVIESLSDLDLDVRPFDRSQAMQAGLLRPATRAFGLSLGDRACLALASALGRPALTTDKAWASLDIGVAIEVIR
jgi:PIN domain nuclease of toxin-antitoxin system